MEGGELFSRIQERGDQAFTERGTDVLLHGEFGLRWGTQFLCDAGKDPVPLRASVSPVEQKPGWGECSSPKGFCESVAACQRWTPHGPVMEASMLLGASQQLSWGHLQKKLGGPESGYEVGSWVAGVHHLVLSQEG